MVKVTLTPEQEAEARRLAEILRRKMSDELLQMARLLVSKSDSEMFGQTEFDLRDRAHGFAAGVLETALQERKKGGTTGRA